MTQMLDIGINIRQNPANRPGPKMHLLGKHRVVVLGLGIDPVVDRGARHTHQGKQRVQTNDGLGVLLERCGIAGRQDFSILVRSARRYRALRALSHDSRACKCDGSGHNAVDGCHLGRGCLEHVSAGPWLICTHWAVLGVKRLYVPGSQISLN